MFNMSGGGFGAMSAVCPTDQNTVLTAVVTKLREEIAEFSSDQTCFVSDTPWPSVGSSENTFVTVCPAGSQFDGDLPDGGGSHQILEYGTFQVTYWTRLSTDQYEHAQYAFQDSDRGILTIKKKILKCLAGRQLYSDYPSTTVPLLTSTLKPLQAMHPPIKQGDGDFSSFSLAFEGPYFWDLS